MSIVSLSDSSEYVITKEITVKLTKQVSSSSISHDDIRHFAQQLNFEIREGQDAEDYLTILRGFEAIMKQTEQSADYIPKGLRPTSDCTSREFWRPGDKYNPLNAWSHRCEIRQTCEGGTLLRDRSIAIKDIISVGELPTTIGISASLFANSNTYAKSPIDATVVSRILASGGVIKGTSTCEAFCASPLAFTASTGPVHNPLLHGFTTGGSSSGSAALVAAHRLVGQGNNTLGETVELAIGTDQAGSVRIPASYNGIYGLKPTFGLIPYTGTASMTPMIDHIGPLASDLEGIAVLLEVMAGYDGYDPRMTPESPLLDQVKPYSSMIRDFCHRLRSSPRDTKSLRVGLLKESFLVPGVSSEVRETVYETARRCFKAAGASVVDISVPMHLQGPSIWTAAARPSMSDWLCRGSPSGHLSFLSPHTQIKWPLSQEAYDMINSTNPAVVNIMLSERFAKSQLKAGLEAKAHRKAFELREAYDRALEEVDILVTPCAPTVAMPHPQTRKRGDEDLTIMEKLKDAIGLTSNTCPFNITGHPALNVPCGSGTHPDHPEVNLPIGMQLVGRRWKDEDVLMAAALFERGVELG